MEPDEKKQLALRIQILSQEIAIIGKYPSLNNEFWWSIFDSNVEQLKQLINDNIPKKLLTGE